MTSRAKMSGFEQARVVGGRHGAEIGYLKKGREFGWMDRLSLKFWENQVVFGICWKIVGGCVAMARMDQRARCWGWAAWRVSVVSRWMLFWVHPLDESSILATTSDFAKQSLLLLCLDCFCFAYFLP